MSYTKFARYGTLCVLVALLFSACSPLQQSTPSTDEQTERMEESAMLTPPSDSIEIEQIQQDLENIEILEEDFGQL